MIITPTLVISCIVIAVLLYLFIKAIDDTRTWLNVLIALLITPVVYFYIWYPICNIFIPYHHHKSFNEAAWIEKPGLRYEMIDTMIDTDFLIGKSKQEVADLLGEVQWLSWDFEQNKYNTNAWNYGLGLLPGAFKTTKQDVEILFENDRVIALKLSEADYEISSEETTETNKVLDSINATFKPKS